MRDKNPGYLKGMRVDVKARQYHPDPRYEKHKNEPILYDYFVEITQGFRWHLDLMGTSNLNEKIKTIRDNSVVGFREAIGNQAVCDYVLGPDFPDTFQHIRDGTPKTVSPAQGPE